MALPTIEGYPLPGADELPGGRVGWPVQAGRAALLVHDMQEHFVAPYGGREPLPEAIANIAALADAARAAGVPVVYTAQPPAQQPEQRGLLADFWGYGIPDGGAAEIVGALAPQPADVVLTKWRYSAFQRTDLMDRLYRSGRDQLVVCGVYAHIGVQATALEGFMADVQTFVVGDAVADFSRSHHDGALAFAAQCCSRVLTTADAVAELSDSGERTVDLTTAESGSRAS